MMRRVVVLLFFVTIAAAAAAGGAPNCQYSDQLVDLRDIRLPAAFNQTSDNVFGHCCIRRDKCMRDPMTDKLDCDLNLFYCMMTRCESDWFCIRDCEPDLFCRDVADRYFRIARVTLK